MRSSVGSLVAVVLLGAACATAGAQNSTTPSARQLYLSGQDAEVSQDYYSAIQDYLEAVAQNPTYLDAVVGLAQSYYALDQFDSALGYVEKARNLARNDTSLMNLQARILLGLGRTADAGDLFRQVLALEPYNVDARIGQAELNVAQGNVDGAVTLYRDAIRLAPQNRKALLSLALVYRSQGRDDAAGDYIRLALQYHSDNAQVHLLAGEYFLSQGRTQDALTQARTALAIQNDYPDALILLAETYLRTGDNSKAVATMDQLIGNSRSSAGAESRQATQSVLTAWYLKGLAHSRAGDSSNAINAFQNLLTLDPGDEIARIALENIIRTSLPVESPDRTKSASYHFQKARDLTAQNLYQEAMVEYRQGLQVAPYSRDARLAYAELFGSEGYRGKYVAELSVLEDLGYKDKAISDRLEAYRSLLADSVASDWGISQFDIPRDLTNISLYEIPAQQTLSHFDAGLLFAGYLRDQLLSHTLVDLSDDPKTVSQFSDAFSDARKSGSDYFILLKVDEANRSLRLDATLYMSRNGAKVQSFTVYRSGTDRVEKASSDLASQIYAAFPEHGRLIARKFNNAVVDLGAMDGVKKDDQFVIVGKGNLSRSSDGTSFVYPPEAAIGDFKVTAVDDQIAVGTVSRRGISDLVAVGDSVVPVAPPPAATAPASAAASAPGAGAAPTPAAQAQGASGPAATSVRQPASTTPPVFPPLFQRLRAIQ